MQQEQQLVVDIGDYKIARNGTIITYALGSCVGIMLYDTERKIAGLSHILLPSIEQCARYSAADFMKFPETAIPAMLKDMLAEGALKRNIVAKIAGGAAMFKTTSAMFSIGDRNIEAVRTALHKLDIRIIASDIGKNYGRTVEVDVQTGEMHVRSMFHGNKTI